MREMFKVEMLASCATNAIPTEPSVGVFKAGYFHFANFQTTSSHGSISLFPA